MDAEDRAKVFHFCGNAMPQHETGEVLGKRNGNKAWQEHKKRCDTPHGRLCSGSAPYRGRLAGERESSSLARIMSGCAAAGSICLDVSGEQSV